MGFGEIEADCRWCSCRDTGAATGSGPRQINYRANIDALKRAGVTDLSFGIGLRLLSARSCAPGTFVLVDQFIDRTIAREKSFLRAGLRRPCLLRRSRQSRVSWTGSRRAVKAQDIPYRRGGTYLAMEGPQFSTRAESHLYRSWGCDVIGMTNMPEAKLAREAEICYATVAMVTDL